jgi:endoglucanase
MIDRLAQAGVARANGFSVNVSNFYTTQQSVDYGEAISLGLNGAHYVIDTGRNGAGSNNGEWCNPASARVGLEPTTQTSGAHNDANLWVNIVGNSDGACTATAPAAGQWYSAYALQLTSLW